MESLTRVIFNDLYIMVLLLYNKIINLFSVITMKPIKTQKSIERKKASEGKNIVAYEYKTKPPSLGLQTHVRSASNGKNKKLRLHTDY